MKKESEVLKLRRSQYFFVLWMEPFFKIIKNSILILQSLNNSKCILL